MAHHFEAVGAKPYRVDDGQVNLGLAVDVEKKDGSRTLMVPVIRDAGRLSFQGFLDAYNALVEKARTNTLRADDLHGANISLTNPGGIGTVASVPRLMVGQGTIVATGSIAYPVGLERIGAAIGAEKVMTMTSTYDHRIIQGAESGRFLQRIEALLQGENELLRARLRRARGGPARAARAARSRRPPPAAAPAAPAPPPRRARRGAAAGRAGRHLAAEGAPHPRPPRRAPGPARPPAGATRARSRPLGLTPEIMARIPAHILRMYVPGATLAEALPRLRETYCGTIAYEIEHIASNRQRLWLREAIESGTYPHPAHHRRAEALLRASPRSTRSSASCTRPTWARSSSRSRAWI